jgi:hypothetical protein
VRENHCVECTLCSFTWISVMWFAVCVTFPCPSFRFCPYDVTSCAAGIRQQASGDMGSAECEGNRI